MTRHSCNKCITSKRCYMWGFCVVCLRITQLLYYGDSFREFPGYFNGESLGNFAVLHNIELYGIVSMI